MVLFGGHPVKFLKQRGKIGHTGKSDQTGHGRYLIVIHRQQMGGVFHSLLMAVFDDAFAGGLLEMIDQRGLRGGEVLIDPTDVFA